MARRDHGTAIAAEVARRLVVPPHRPGAQDQYVSSPVLTIPASALAPLLDWARSRLDQQLTLRLLARQADTTTRTLTRRFTAELGLPPLQWLTAERVRRARQLLEDTGLSIEQLAQQSGLGTAANLRLHFIRQAATTPTAYRAGAPGGRRRAELTGLRVAAAELLLCLPEFLQAGRKPANSGVLVQLDPAHGQLVGLVVSTTTDHPYHDDSSPSGSTRYTMRVVPIADHELPAGFVQRRASRLASERLTTLLGLWPRCFLTAFSTRIWT